MLEEGSGAMEKKVLTRQSQGQCKNSGALCERKSDSTSGRHGFSRRSFPNGGAKSQDASQAPRPIPVQKWDRTPGDRRPRQRISPDHRQREKVEENETIYDVISTGSRKGNANHLLNFKHRPHQVQADDHRWHSGRNRFGSHGHGGNKRFAHYKKEQFLQASCHFVVRDTRDYVEQASDSDALVDWRMVELVRSFSTEPVNCPICLQTLSAGKITKCGHTYCWPCILHYIKLGEQDFGKCPICFDNIDLEDLKSVQWLEVPDYKVGDEIEMKLMRKSKGSVFSAPAPQWQDRKGKHMHMDEGENTKYMKLLVASCDQIQSNVIDVERAALIAQIEDAEEEAEMVFINMALELLKVREQLLKEVFQDSAFDKIHIPGLGLSQFSTKPKEQPGVDRDSVRNSSCSESVEGEDSVVGEGAETADLLDCTMGYPSSGTEQACSSSSSTLIDSVAETDSPLDSGPPQSKTSHTLNTKDDYFFYQASSGQHIYLNSLNAQCLAKEYSSLENSPGTVTGTIVAIDRIFMTEDVRKRLRYLSHIPLTCEFHVLELKLKPDLVSKETLKFYEGSFDKRRKMRQQKAREDRKRDRKIEMEQRRSYGLCEYPGMQIPLDSLEQFPSYLSASLEEEGYSQQTFPTVSRSPTETASMPPPHPPRTHRESEGTWRNRVRNDSTASDDSGTMSFAQMLKAGKVSTPLPALGGAWGGAGLAVSPSISGTMPGLSSLRKEEDSEGESLPAPSYSESMSDAIARALEGFDHKDASSPGTGLSAQTSKTGGGKKKRKERKILLSSMARTS